MAKSVKINNVTYPAVPSVSIPLSTGSGSAIFYETSEATIQPQHIMAGYKGFGPNGLVEGTATVPAVSQDSATKVLSIT